MGENKGLNQWMMWLCVGDLKNKKSGFRDFTFYVKKQLTEILKKIYI